MSIPCDGQPALRGVTWAAIRLHHGVRDALGQISAPSDEYFDATLGAAVRNLRRAADQRLVEPDRTAMIQWCDQVGTPAVEQRNGVLHAIAYTDPDGRQALRGSKAGRPKRYLEPELLTVAGILDVASLALPHGPYDVRPQLLRSGASGRAGQRHVRAHAPTELALAVQTCSRQAP